MSKVTPLMEASRKRREAAAAADREEVVEPRVGEDNSAASGDAATASGDDASGVEATTTSEVPVRAVPTPLSRAPGSKTARARTVPSDSAGAGHLSQLVASGNAKAYLADHAIDMDDPSTKRVNFELPYPLQQALRRYIADGEGRSMRQLYTALTHALLADAKALPKKQ
jgi:hypothetical protein